MSDTFPGRYANEFEAETLSAVKRVWQDRYDSDPQALIQRGDYPGGPYAHETTDIVHTLKLTCGQCTTETGQKSDVIIAKLDRHEYQWVARRPDDGKPPIWYRVTCPTCHLFVDIRSIQVQARLEQFLWRKQVPGKTQLTYLADLVNSHPLTAAQLEIWLDAPPIFKDQ